MKEHTGLPSSKRRKVSNDNKWTSSRDRDQGRNGVDHDIYSLPSGSDAEDVAVNGDNHSDEDAEEDPERVALKKAKTKVPRSGGIGRRAKIEDNNDDSAAGTPTRRSSGRVRKAPQRLNPESTPTTKLSTRRALFTPSNSGNKRTEKNGTLEAEKRLPQSSSSLSSKKPAKKQPAVRPSRSSGKKAVWDVPSDDEIDVIGKAEAEVLEPEPELEPDEQGSPSPSSNPDDEGDALAISEQLQQNLLQQEEFQVQELPVHTKDLPQYAQEFKTLCEDHGLDDHLASLSRLVLGKLTGKRLTPLKGLQNEYQKVHQLVEHTVVAGEGNSILLIGSRGCGKTTLVETALSSLKKEHKEDFYVVRLNGFLHTDDRVALREIWRQLGREMDVDDDVAKINNYADTMASLLALLSHPEELYGRTENPDTIQTAKSVIIVLDEFDLFASHPRQTLLYNLFDIAQARKAPLAVLGVTTKVDVTENLEKRVKSRYSHRYVFLPRPRTFQAFSEICMAGLALGPDEIVEDPMDPFGEESDAVILKSDEGTKLVEGWGKYLHGLWEDPNFESHLQQIYHLTKSPKDFFTSALIPLTTIHHSTYSPSSKQHAPQLQIPTPSSFITQSLSCPDPAPLPFPPTTTTTSSASTISLPLSLLLAATRLTALHDPGLNSTRTTKPTSLNLSFSIAYAEYVRLLTSAKASASASGVTATAGRVWGREVARESWGKLVGWGILVPVSNSTNAGGADGEGGGGGGMEDGRMFRAEVSFEEVVEIVGVGGSLGRWWRDG